MTGVAYWVRVLAPYAAAGYLRGEVDADEVVLFNGTGPEIHLPRPSAAWQAASLLLPALDDADDHDPEVLRGVKYLMRSGKDRMELEV